MGIYIENYKKPQDCKKCIFYFGDLLCWAKLRCGGSRDCPIIDVPDHGDLIDRDALSAAMYHEAFETDSKMQKWDSGCWIRYKMFENKRDNAPVIIPAERSEE